MDKNIEERVKELHAEIAELKKRTTAIENSSKDQLSMVILSGDFDRILAAMIIAVGAAAMDTEVKLLFTFWGTAALRD